jgi:hypothetical protein
MPADVLALTALANITLGSAQASVTFSSISQAYRDLIFVVVPLSASTEELGLQLNTDTGSNYSHGFMRGNGSSASAYTGSGTSITLGATAYSYTDSRSVFNIVINDYSATDKHKTVLIRSNDYSSAVEAGCGRWANTDAVTTVRLFGRFGVNFAAGTTVALYGVSS